MNLIDSTRLWMANNAFTGVQLNLNASPNMNVVVHSWEAPAMDGDEWVF
jgi:hypothetical protein